MCILAADFCGEFNKLVLEVQNLVGMGWVSAFRYKRTFKKKSALLKYLFNYNFINATFNANIIKTQINYNL